METKNGSPENSYLFGSGIAQSSSNNVSKVCTQSVGATAPQERESGGVITAAATKDGQQEECSVDRELRVQQRETLKTCGLSHDVSPPSYIIS